MKKGIQSSVFIMAAMLLSGCELERTHYDIQYCFDNTDMHSDFLEVYELIDSVRGNGKWRSNPHKLDTVVIDGDTIEWASGKISEVARDNCVGLSVHTSGWRPCGGGNYDLDTIFFLNQGERNFIVITPSMAWHNHYE